MNPETSAHSVSTQEANKVRAARGFQSFPHWKRENRKWASEHRRNGKGDLADALDREYDRYIAGNI